MGRRMLRSMLAAACALALASCGSEEPPAPSPERQSQEPASPDSTQEPAPTPKALRFDARTVGGNAYEAKTLAGQDAVFWFWAPWCTECRREAPHVASVQKAAGQDVTFVGVAGLGPVNDMKAFVRDYRVGAFDHLADLDGSIWKRFGVVEQPAHAFVDDDGTVTLVRGELDERALTKHVDDLIAD